MIDRPKLREARKLLERLFPDFEDLRHSIAHAGELLHEPDGLKKHAANGVSMRDCLSGRQFVNTFEGKFQSYELSQEFLDGLREVKRLVYEAFRPASDETRKRTAEKRKAGGP